MYRSSPFRSTLNRGYITALDMCEVCTKAVHSVALWTQVTLQLWTCSKNVLAQAVHSVALRTRVTLQLWTCVKYVPVTLQLWTCAKYVLVQAVHSVALWTRVTLQLWTCVKYVPKQSIPQHFEHMLHYSFGHLWRMYRSSPCCSTLNTGYITALDICEVCTEAVHSIALWTRVTLQLWACVK